MYTIALLPNRATQKKLILFSKEHKDDFVSGCLTAKTNQPHVTLLKTAFKNETNLNELLNVIVNEYKIDNPSGILQGIQKDNRRNLTSKLTHDENIVWLHNFVLSQVKPFVDKSGIKMKKFVGGTVEEVENYFKYGYRYTGDKFSSHVSFGKIGDDEVPYQLEKDFEANLMGQELIFNRIAICRSFKNSLGYPVVVKKLNPKRLFVS